MPFPVHQKHLNMQDLEVINLSTTNTSMRQSANLRLTLLLTTTVAKESI